MKKSTARILLIVFILLLGFFLSRAFFSYQALIEKQVTGHAKVDSVRGWMTVRYIGRLYDVSEDCLCAELGITGDCGKTPAGSVFRENNVPFEQASEQLRLAVFRCRRESGDGPIIGPWMEVDLAADIYNADPKCVCDAFHLPPGQCVGKKLGELVRGERPHDLNASMAEIQEVIAACGQPTKTPPEKK